MAQTSPASLFDSPTPASLRVSTDPTVLRSRVATVAIAEIEASAARWTNSKQPSVEQLTLNLFADTTVTAELETVETLLPGRTSWVGHIVGVEGSSVVLVTGEGLADGQIYTGSSIFTLGMEAGEQVIREVDPTALPSLDEPLVPPSFSTGSKATALKAGDNGLVFDLMVVYTAQAKARAGGQSAMDNFIVSTVSLMNLSFARSNIVPRVRLVGASEVNYVETGGADIDLRRLTSPNDGYMDEVHALRNEKGADFVQLFLGTTLRGFAWILRNSNDTGFERWAFGTAGLFPTISIHELGHNLGCHHAPDDANVGPGVFPYSHAYVEHNVFVTVMRAYPRLNHISLINFSNPAVTILGFPTGTATQDNARTINETRNLAANFRQSVPGVCPWSVGHPRYCADCGPCLEGEGDCDGDVQCAGSLVCVDDVGANYGFGPTIDVCESVCPWPAGHGRFCLDCGPCFAGQGDCDDDSQCLAGLTCRQNVGTNYGFGAGVDVCEDPCLVPLGDPNYCALCGPCTTGEGDCDAGQCQSGLACVDNVGANYGFAPGTDVCETPPLVRQFPVLADSYAAQQMPNTNFGSENKLRVRFQTSGLTHYSFLKFNVPALVEPILSAKLRLRTQGSAIGEAGFYDADIAPWTETGITWNNWDTPPSNPTYMRSLNNLAPNTWYEVDVSEAVLQPGELTLGIASGSDFPNQDFWSRESAWAPVLLVTYQQ